MYTGKKGAILIYKKIDEYFSRNQKFLKIEYDNFRNNETQHKLVIDFFELNPTESQRKSASNGYCKSQLKDK